MLCICSAYFISIKYTNLEMDSTSYNSYRHDYFSSVSTENICLVPPWGAIQILVDFCVTWNTCLSICRASDHFISFVFPTSLIGILQFIDASYFQPAQKHHILFVLFLQSGMVPYPSVSSCSVPTSLLCEAFPQHSIPVSEHL